MTILSDLTALHEGFLQAMSKEPTRLYVDPFVQALLDDLRPVDWPFQHLAERATHAGTDTAIAEMFGLEAVIFSDQTRFA
jgi:hypothetical protein